MPPLCILHCAFCIRREAAAGGGSRTRTGDIRLAKPTLYQLSYAPLGRGRRGPAAVLSVLEDSSFRFGRRGGQALRAMCRRVGPTGEDGASPSGLFDELTIGVPIAREPSP